MRKDAQENRQEILRVARFLIAQQGSDVSLRTIASTAGVGIATLYRNFPTREDLLLGIVRETAEEAEAAIAECLETWDADPEQAWRNYAHAVARQKIATFAMRMVETPGIEERSSSRSRRHAPTCWARQKQCWIGRRPPGSLAPT